MLGFIVVLVLLIGSFATGVDISIRIGDTGSSGVALGDGTFLAEDGAIVDEEGNVVAEAGSDEAKAAASAALGPGAGTAGAARAGRQAAASGSRSATGAAAGGSAAPVAAAPASCDGVTLTATDQGVTAETIKLGFLIPNLNELQAAGFDVGLVGDFDKIISAWVKEMNDNGGVACRQIIWVKEVFDVLSVDDMLAKCKAMTEDHKVFSVMTPGGYDSVAQLCIAKEHKTPFINPEPEPEGWYRESAPYLWNLLMSKDRMHRNHIRWLLDAGELIPGDPTLPTSKATKVGVVYHGIPNVAPPVEDTLLPELARGGVKPLQVVSLSSDTQQALAQINQVVLQFRQAGVEYVLMPMNLIFKAQFMQVAERQEYFPTYTDSDHYFGCFDFVTGAYPERSWQGTKCVSAIEIAGWQPERLRAYANAHPYQQYADEVYLRAHPEGYDNNGESDQRTADTQRALHSGTGSQILLWKQAADRVGPNLTRPAWGASMGQTGAFDKITLPNPLTFGPEKWDGPDRIVVVEWHAEAGDGWDARMYRQIVGARLPYA